MSVVSEEEKIPVIILAGFLGAGKTTTLNHLLHRANGRKIGVIVNDFGEVNIDALLVSKQTDSTMELSGGCICCQMSDGGLDETLETFAHPGTTIDAIIVEASGIAEPADLRKLVLYSANKMTRLGGVVYVIDVPNFNETMRSHPEVEQHLLAADLLLLNKIDVATDTQRAKVEKHLKKLCPNTPTVATSHGKITPELLFDAPAQQEEQLPLTSTETGEHTHLHDQFSSLSFSSKKPLSPKRFEAFLEQLPPEVYRLKGIIYYGMKGFEQKIIFHKTGRHATWNAEEWRGYETPQTDIVAIGTDIQTDILKKQLEACIDPEPDEISADDMVDIMRLKGF